METVKLPEYINFMPAAVLTLLWLEHNARGTKEGAILLGIIFTVGIVSMLWTFAKYFSQSKVNETEFVALLLNYGAALYILLAENLIGWGAKWLNQKRGARWIRELEYPYLFFGVIGLLITINKMEIMEGRMSGLDLLGPLVLATAVVIKLVKTRAEIEEWQKK